MSESMLELALGRGWEGTGWTSSVSGGGSVSSDADGILTTTAAAAGVAVVRAYFPALPGMRIETKVWGRYLSGAATGTGVFYDLMDYNAGNFVNLVDRVDISALDWKRYTLAYTVPDNEDVVDRFIRLNIGVKDVLGGDARWHSPSVKISRAFGAPVVLAKGAIQMATGTPTILTTHPSMGIASVAFDGVDDVTVTLTHSILSSPTFKPLVFISPISGGFVPVIKSMTTGAAPTVVVRWTNGTSIQNISAVANLEFHLMVTW